MLKSMYVTTVTCCNPPTCQILHVFYRLYPWPGLQLPLAFVIYVTWWMKSGWWLNMVTSSTWSTSFAVQKGRNQSQLKNYIFMSWCQLRKVYFFLASLLTNLVRSNCRTVISFCQPEPGMPSWRGRFTFKKKIFIKSSPFIPWRNQLILLMAFRNPAVPSWGWYVDPIIYKALQTNPRLVS